MKRIKNIRVLSRTMAVIAVFVVVIAGVAFALLQSQQDTLTGNTIETATADLRLSTNGVTYANSQHGFDFNGLIPGGTGQPAAGYPMYLQNAGGSPLALKLAITSVPTNPNNVDLSKVTVLLTTVGSGTGAQSFSLQALITAATTGGLAVTGGSLPNGASQQYKLQVSMASDALSGSTAAIGNLDLAITGVAVPN